MIEERLIQSLQKKEYKLLKSNIEGVYLLYRIENDACSIISAMHAFTGEEYTVEQYEHMLTQIKADFKKRGLYSIQLLSLIFTYNPEKVKKFCLMEDDHWIINLTLSQLIIYETQSSEFMGIREMIEPIIEEELNHRRQQGDMENDLAYQKSAYDGIVRHNRADKIKIFTLFNTIIIILNIIAYLIMHHTELLGGTNEMIRRGGLFWYYVMEEHQYYRFFSSIFMHSGFGHLFNNMIVLLFVGDNLERAAGKLKYLLLYFGSGIIADITSILYNMMKDQRGGELIAVYSIGASGAIFGVVGAMLYIIIRNKGQLEDISSRQMILFVIFSFYGGITNVGIDNAAHIGGFIAGVLLAMVLYRRPEKTK